MAKELHEALTVLRPKDWSDIPVDDLETFLHDVFAKAELITNSVPPPPGGDDYLSSKPARNDANAARSAKDLIPSQARPPLPAPEHQALRDSWGKPVKVGAKDNPLGLTVYKMAGNDRHGAWFARRSVHEGMGFAKWKRAMQTEFAESLAVEGGPGEGNVRGIGGDRKLEERVVAGVGKLEGVLLFCMVPGDALSLTIRLAYQLSAQFPGPTAPREFITLLLTSDNVLSELSAPRDGNNVSTTTLPRHYIVVSIPLTHPDAPPRSGLVRGMYESVEMIREIPLTSSKSASMSNLLSSKHEAPHGRDRGSTISYSQTRGPDAKGERVDRGDRSNNSDAESNPVEWIMITRSDPGGGIPRFMVERNVPSSICSDAVKFVNWAAGKDDFLDESTQADNSSHMASPSEEHPRMSFDRHSIVDRNAALAGVGTSIADNPPPMFRRISQRSEKNRGIIDTITNAVGNGIETYLPASMQSKLPGAQDDGDFSDSSSDTSSTDSFASAEQYTTAEGLTRSQTELVGKPSESYLTMGGSSGASTPMAEEQRIQRAESRYDRELGKIEEQKAKLAARLARQRDKDKASSEASTAKALSKHERETQKQQAKYQKEIQKLERKKQREAQKLEERRKKEEAKDTVRKAIREKGEWKAKYDVVQKENGILKQQVGDLQRELTTLVARVGQLDGGNEILNSVREEVSDSTAKKTSDSIKSGGSGRDRAVSRLSEGSNSSGFLKK